MRIQRWVSPVATALIALAARAENTSFERQAVETKYGQVVVLTEPYRLYPISNDVGLVYEQAIHRDGAARLRIHLRVHNTPMPDCGWAVRLRDVNHHAVWRHAGNAPALWSDEVSGDTATVEIFSVTPQCTLELEVDRLMVASAEISPKSISGTADWEDVANTPPEIRRMGTAVARLRFIGDDDFAYVCTGFVLHDRYLMTNYHCISSEKERETAVAAFDYETQAEPTVLRHFSRILAKDRNLDYSLLALDEPLGRRPLELNATTLVKSQHLFLIEHPRGRPKKISRTRCEVTDLALPGWSVPTLTDFGHSCDTESGSSGAPLIDPKDGTVVGLHHLGFDQDKNIFVNRAVSISAIRDSIRAQDGSMAEALGFKGDIR